MNQTITPKTKILQTKAKKHMPKCYNSPEIRITEEVVDDGDDVGRIELFHGREIPG